MDFEKAKQAHFDWKRKLSDYLKAPNGSLKAADVSVDNKCDLGKWIYGEGAAFKELPEYQQLVDLHKQFHKAAAEVVAKADSGQKVTEDIAVGSQSEFGKASSGVILCINRLTAKIK